MTLSKNIVDMMLELLPEPGVIGTPVPGLALVRSDQIMDERQPIVYDPCIYVVVQGSKVAHLGDEIFTYDALNYLVLSVPLPLECQILNASKEEPYLAIRVDIDTRLLNGLIHELPVKDIPRELAVNANRGIYVSAVDEDISSTLIRLVSCISNPEKAKVLGPMAVKELLFHVLFGEQGHQLQVFAYRDKHNFQIAEVLNFIQKNYSMAMEVDELAAMANMSQSSFHVYFKAVTNVTPIQYIKTMRLHEARRKMLHDNQSASDAAFQVGYASPSQFSREYRRLFGAAPTKDIDVAKQVS